MITIEAITAQVRATVGVKPSVLLLLGLLSDRLDAVNGDTGATATFLASIRTNAEVFAAAIGENGPPYEPSPNPSEQSNADRASKDAQRQHNDAVQQGKDADRAHKDAVKASK